MIRILHVLQGMNRGGQETFIMNLYRVMDRRSIQFDFLLNDRSINDYEAEILAMGGRVYKTVTKGSGYGRFIRHTNEVVRGFEETYEVAHFHSGSLKSIYGWAFTDVFKIKHKLCHSHNTHYDNDFKVLKPLMNRLTPHLFSGMYACSTEAGFWLYGKRLMASQAVQVIANGVDLEAFAYNPIDRKILRQTLGVEGCRVIGHIGRFVDQKNHAFLIGVFAALVQKDPSYRLLLIGEGPLLEAVKQEVGVLGLSNYVQFLGNRSDVAKLYSVFDVFLLPSLYEGLPVVGVEAQAAGLPLLGSDTISKELSLTDGVTYMSLNQPPEKWAEVLSGLVEQKRNRQAYADLGIHRYDIHEIGAYFQEVYRQLAMGK